MLFLPLTTTTVTVKSRLRAALAVVGLLLAEVRGMAGKDNGHDRAKNSTGRRASLGH